MAGSESDFDIKMIVKHPNKSYMLQEIGSKNTTQVITELNNIVVEGQSMDAVLVYKYICECNPMITECFGGIPILKTQASEEMMELWYEAYNWVPTRH